MDLNCGTSQCIYYILLTIVGVIAATVILDFLLYFGYSYFIVRRYYSTDIAQWRKKQLSKFGSGGGYIAQKWEEVYPPDENMKMSSFTANTDSLFGLDAGEVYTCKKPCNGTSDDTFWSKVSAPSKINKLAASDDSLWVITADGTLMFKNMSTGKWVKSKQSTSDTDKDKASAGGFTNISADGKWAVKNKNPFKCNDMECTVAEIPTVTVQQIVNGQTVTWALTNGGELYYEIKINDEKDEKSKWQRVNTPAVVKYVTVGSADEVYIVTEEDLYVSEDGTLDDPKWLKIPNAPKFVSLAVNKDIYGIDVNGKMWKA